MKNLSLNFILLSALVLPASSFAQTNVKSSSVTKDVNEKEENSNSSNPKDVSINVHSTKYRKKQILPAVIAPAPASASANCADNLAGGAGSYTACEAGKKDR
ncbi:MAG: hypothetical protein H7177_06410 [Rhizobacter sp.]|nr:hypothetical protein [Bacteriovorax sp.]